MNRHSHPGTGISSQFSDEAADGARIDEALALAFRDALRTHRLAGEPVAVMDDGTVELVRAEQIEQELVAELRRVQ